MKLLLLLLYLFLFGTKIEGKTKETSSKLITGSSSKYLEKGELSEELSKNKLKRKKIKQEANSAEVGSRSFYKGVINTEFLNQGSRNTTNDLINYYGPYRYDSQNNTFEHSAYFGTTKNEQITLNSIGNEINIINPSSILVTNFPYTITRCDQIVKFKAKYIVDMSEYRNREEAWFTLTAYYTNMFKDEKADELIRSILMSSSPQAPYHPKGAMPCILITSPIHGDKDITICMETKIEMDNILQVLKDFKDECRDGGYKLNKLKITKSLLNCMKDAPFTNPRTLLRRLRKKNILPIEVKDRKWFHPGSDRIPGSLPPKPTNYKLINLRSER